MNRLLAGSDSVALFTNLPTKQLLTLNMDTPRTWLVQPVAAVYDLDNIRLGEMGDDHLLSARFKLEHILTEGKALAWYDPLHCNTLHRKLCGQIQRRYASHRIAAEHWHLNHPSCVCLFVCLFPTAYPFADRTLW